MIRNDNGYGHFDPADSEAMSVWDDIESEVNNRFSSFIEPLYQGDNATCEDTYVDFISDSGIRFDFNRVFIDNTVLFEESQLSCSANGLRLLLQDLLDIEYPEIKCKNSINIIMPTDEDNLIEVLNGGEYEGCFTNNATYPHLTDFDKVEYVFLSNRYTKYLHMKDVLPLSDEYPDYTWEAVIRGWFVSSMSRGIEHELGHCLGLAHWNEFHGENECLSSLMHQSGSTEGEFLQPSEIGKMHRALELTSVRSKVKNTSYSEIPIVVSQDETWSNNRKIFRPIRVTNGSTLTITCTLLLHPQATIIVEPGARLILNGGVLSNFCDEPWQGIEVWGNSNASQTPSNQGELRVINGALIENARNAVTLWKPDDWSKTGGIIKASNSTFRNNRRSVEFMSYQNVQVNGAIASNRSYFRNCSFETNDDCIIPEQQNEFMITMWQVSGVGIWGCEFKNERDVSSVEYLRGAIESSDSNFEVDNYCDELLQIGEPCPLASTTHSTFTGFNKAIHARGAEQNVGPSIKNAVFDKNMIGIEFDAVIAPSATFNDFTVGNNDFEPIVEGEPIYHLAIHTNNCDEYILEENTVEGDDVNGFTTHGIYVYDDMYSANSNQIYKNTYEDVSSATIASGIHGNPSPTMSSIGLKFLCNMNQNNTNDFEVRGFDDDDYSEISNYQDGPGGTTAGNEFSSGDDGDGIYTHLDFFSDANYIYFKETGETDPDEDEIIISPPGNIAIASISSNNTCLTNFPEDDGNIDEGFQLGKFSGGKEEFNNLYYTYLQLLDEGNTDGMITEIDLTWPEDAWDLHAELMSRSPYNSEAVLMAAADKNVLTHGMLLEILLANPDALLSGTVINHVENNIANPLPPYMIDILYQAARNPQTVRTEMERNLSSLHQEMVSSHKHLVNHYLNDTINALHPDTLIHWFSQIRNLSGRYQQIFAYTGVNQYTNAFAVIDSIETNYKLSNKQQHELTNAEDFVSFLQTIYQDGRNVAQLTPAELSELERIANETPGGIAAERAENILCFHYNICIDESGAPKNNGTKARRIEDEDPQELMDKLTDLRVKPNPADQYIELEYEVFESSKENILRVFDTNGRVIEMWNLGMAAKGIKVLDTRELPNGVYYFEIVQDSQQLKSGKFMVQH